MNCPYVGLPEGIWLISYVFQSSTILFCRSLISIWGTLKFDQCWFVVSSSVRNFFCFCLLLVALTANLRRSIRLSHKKLVPGLAFQLWNKQLKVWEMPPQARLKHASSELSEAAPYHFTVAEEQKVNQALADPETRRCRNAAESIGSHHVRL